MITKYSIQKWKELVSEYVASLFVENKKPALLYHNFKHTQLVVARAKEIALHYPVNEVERFILYTAACFHDTGQLFTSPRYHEEKSAIIMQDYLLNAGMDASIVHEIKECIISTKIPHEPKTLLHEILCDADTYNLGTDEFLLTDDLLKAELVARSELYTDQWDRSTLIFLENHRYFTPYCQRLLNEGKMKNIEMIKARINNIL